LSLLLLLLLLPPLAQAKSNAPPQPADAAADPTQKTAVPIQIDAAGSLIWRQEDKTYHAVGDASATRGTLNVKGDELTAHYVEGPGGQNQIQLLEAQGHVIITNNGNTAVGPYARYNMVTEDMNLIGKDLKLTNAKGETLTAQQEIWFNNKTGQSYALGQPFLARPDRTLAADRLDAQFIKDAQGSWTLQTATATGHVVVTTGIGTPNPSVTLAENGFYDAVHDKALLTGNVKITRSKNQMNGDRAEINMASGESRLLPSAQPLSPNARVHALLYQNK